MARGRWAVNAAAGVACALGGWTLGGLAGSLMWRSVVALAAIATLHGFVLRGARGAVVVGAAGTLVAAGAYAVGTHTLTPLLAWPVLGFALGASSAWGLSGLWRRIVVVGFGAAMVSGLFVVGLILVVFLGFARNDGWLWSQLFLGGALASGIAPATIAAYRGRLDRQSRQPEGASS